MRYLLIILYIILRMHIPDQELFHIVADYIVTNNSYHIAKQCNTPMEALDLVKEHYANNFDKIIESTENQYYYKLEFADYYLEYEGEVGVEKDYLIHLYEFVVDEPDSGVGHMVTYGWYIVDSENGTITEQSK